jgi:hypothetical protein
MTSQHELIQELLGSSDGTEEPQEVDEGDSEVEAPDPVTVLKQDVEAQLSDLRRSVGRVQSLASQFNTGKATDTTGDELREKFQETSEQLDMLVTGLDGVIDPETRDKLITARQQARAVAERTSLRNEIIAELTPAPAAQPNQADAVTQLANAYEKQLIGEIEAFDLDPNDTEVFDWSKAGSYFQAGDYDGMTKYIRGQIREAITADTPAARRQARKGAANPAPTPQDPGGRTVSEKILEDGDISNLDDAILELQKLGITV